MFAKTVVYLLLYFTATTFSPGCSQIDKHSEYALIQADVEYISASFIDDLNNLNDIQSAIQCSIKCLFNKLCQTATYYEDLKQCHLFSSNMSQGMMFAKAHVKIIHMNRRNLTDTVRSNRWYPVGNMANKRAFVRSTFIASTNSVLIVGGYDGSSLLSTVETFFVSNGSFVRRNDTTAPRGFNTVDHLIDHLVIVAGGYGSSETADSYDGVYGIPNGIIQLNVPRAEHASAILGQGNNISTKLLLVGGLDATDRLATGDVFDSSTGKFTLVDNNMTSARYYHTATTINNEYVLIAGGMNNDSIILDTLELYNSTSNMFVSLSVRMSSGRVYHSATYIPSIQSVLIVGGRSQTNVLQTYDLFNVSTFTFTVLNGTTLFPRAYQTATLLLDEQVLLVGGQNDVRLASCELYNPRTNTFMAASNMSTDRADHTTTLLTNTGQVLVCGGQNQNDQKLNSCELYQP